MYFSRPQAVSECFSANLHPKSTVQGHFTVAIGHTLRKHPLLSLVIHVCFMFMITFALCFTMASAHRCPKMWGQTQATASSSHPYFGYSLTLGLLLLVVPMCIAKLLGTKFEVSPTGTDTPASLA